MFGRTPSGSILKTLIAGLFLLGFGLLTGKVEAVIPAVGELVCPEATSVEYIDPVSGAPIDPMNVVEAEPLEISQLNPSTGVMELTTVPASYPYVDLYGNPVGEITNTCLDELEFGKQLALPTVITLIVLLLSRFGLLGSGADKRKGVIIVTVFVAILWSAAHELNLSFNSANTGL